MQQPTGKTRPIVVLGKALRFCNQRCKGWDYPYDYPGQPNDTLASSGCGLFSLAHVVEYLTGQQLSLEALSDFARRTGGRGDDGTDRPTLLQALMDEGLAAQYGFSYAGDGLLNDHERLWNHLANEGGTALCNLRVGHIVALLGARERDGERQVLAVDSYSESASEKVRDAVREILPETEILADVKNAAGLLVGQTCQHAAFWVRLDVVRDYNLLHRL